MGLCRLVYVSGRRCVTSHHSVDHLQAITDAAMRNNEKLGITGLLLVTSHRYIQVLEGKQCAVHDLYNLIKDDSRHSNPLIRQVCAVQRRNYADWSMKVISVEHVGRALYGFASGSQDFDPYDLSQETLSSLIEICSRSESAEQAALETRDVGYLD